MLLSQIN